MSVKFSNNGHSTLAASLASNATSITVASGHGARFPSLSSGEYFYATLIDASNNLEIVKVTARSSDVLTVTRAQESTTARAYAIGDRIELRVTAAGITDATNIDDTVPAQSSHSGKFLTTDGTNVSWAAAGTNASDLTSGTLAHLRLPTDAVLQVVYASNSSNVQLANDQNYITAVSASITPKATSSKVLIISMGAADITNGNYRAINWRIERDSSAIFTTQYHMYDGNTQSHNIDTSPMVYLDSPSSTSSLAYTLRGRHQTGSSFSGTYDGFLNRYSASSLTLIEIAG